MVLWIAIIIIGGLYLIFITLNVDLIKLLDTKRDRLNKWLKQRTTFSFVIGYAGGDFIENVFKIMTKQESLFNLDSLIKK